MTVVRASGLLRAGRFELEGGGVRDGRFAWRFAALFIGTGDCFRCREFWRLGVEARNGSVDVRSSDAFRI